jgi:phosphatidylinositol alpha-1,6-mannosyltransferase
LQSKNCSILAITNSWPPVVSGHGRFFFQLLHLYDNKIVITTSAVPNDSGDLLPVLKYAKSSGGFLRFRTLMQHFEILWKPLWITFRMRQKPQATIASQVLFSGLASYFIYKLFKIPYIIVGHGEEFSIYYHDSSKIKYRLSKVILSNADSIICNASSTEEILNKHYDIERIKMVVIHPVVDIGESSLDIRTAKQNKELLIGNNRMVLMTGRLWEKRKGFDTGIIAFSKASRLFDNIRLIIAGPGDNTYLKEVASQSGVQDLVFFTGLVDRNTLLSYYATCDIFLMPNKTLDNGDAEGFGIVFLEANLFGKPVIGGNSGGAIDAVEDGVSGILVNGDDVESVVDALVKLLSDDALREKMGQLARERVWNQFNNAVQFKRFKEVIAKFDDN